MDYHFHVRNSTGEDWPAFGMARLGTVVERDGVNEDIPIYELKKPDSTAGIYVVNGGGILEDGDEGGALHYTSARFVLVEEDATHAVGASIGHVADKWTAGSGGSEFTVLDEKNDHDIVPVVAMSGSSSTTTSGGGGGGGSCECACVDHGDLLITGIETTSKWSVSLSQQKFEQTYGNIILPAGTYVVEWVSSSSTWTLDIGDDLTAAFNDGSDATSVTTMDGTLTLTWSGVGSTPSLKLCVDGTIPAPSGS